MAGRAGASSLDYWFSPRLGFPRPYPMTGVMVTVLLENETAEVPTLLVCNLTELKRTGEVSRNALRGELQLFDDASARQRVGLLIPAQLVDMVLDFLGIDPEKVPAPGTACDAI